MINIHLCSQASWDNEINFLDRVENINSSVEDYYKNFKIRFFTCDINVHRLTNNDMFISDPWVLFVVYNQNKKYFECTFDSKDEKIFKKFVSLNRQVKPGREHRIILLDFIQKENIDCFYSNLFNNITLTEIPEYYPNGYWKGEFDWGVPKEYFLGLIDIVTEGSSEMSTHFSEKSYKALFYKKPFICIAGPYWYETFVKHGFELYDEIFDYSFDTIENRDDRIDDILLQIKSLNSYSYEELTKKIDIIKPKIEHNYNHLFTLQSTTFKHITHDNNKEDTHILMED
jgi:hypothetical protein